MINALAPGMRRGCSWVGVWMIALVCGFVAPGVARAQPAKGSTATKKTAPAAKKADTKKAAPAAAKADEPEAGEENAAPEEEVVDQKKSKVEVFKDPRAEAALKIIKPLPYRAVAGNVYTQLRSAAATPGGPVDRDLIKRFVEGMAHDLTDRNNLNALIKPPSGPPQRGPAVRAVQVATDNLIDVLQTARMAKNADFLSAYNAALLETLPKLLDNNLIARLQAMIVLGQSRNPSAVPLFIAQLKDPNQTVWVKLWAAKGLSAVVDGGARVDTLGAQPIEAARVLADLLDSQKDLPWPVQVRVLEALGAMRVASQANSPKAEMATTAMKYLADPEAHAEVRAEAARALGMVRVNQATRNYNYALIAYNTGLLTVDLAEKINGAFQRNKTLSEYLTDLLIRPIHQSFNGMEGARESGLLKVPGGYPTMANTRQIADLTSAVTRASLELVRGAPGQAPKLQKDLDDRIAGLKAYLDKNPPQGYRLVPNGPEFPRAGAQVAKAPVEKPGVDGGHGR